jgi:hypothetical protein
VGRDDHRQLLAHGERLLQLAHLMPRRRLQQQRRATGRYDSARFNRVRSDRHHAAL